MRPAVDALKIDWLQASAARLTSRCMLSRSRTNMGSHILRRKVKMKLSEGISRLLPVIWGYDDEVRILLPRYHTEFPRKPTLGENMYQIKLNGQRDCCSF